MPLMEGEEDLVAILIHLLLVVQVVEGLHHRSVSTLLLPLQLSEELVELVAVGNFSLVVKALVDGAFKEAVGGSNLSGGYRHHLLLWGSDAGGGRGRAGAGGRLDHRSRKLSRLLETQVSGYPRGLLINDRDQLIELLLSQMIRDVGGLLVAV